MTIRISQRSSKIICFDPHRQLLNANALNIHAKRNLTTEKLLKLTISRFTRRFLSKPRIICVIPVVTTTEQRRCCNLTGNSMGIELGAEFEVAREVGQLSRQANKELMPLYPPGEYKDVVLLFLKLFDRAKEDLRYVGRLLVKVISKPAEILSGYASDQEIELYCTLLDHSVVFTNRQVVHFHSLDKTKEQAFCLELVSTYDDVVGRIARQLQLDDPSKIRLASHNCYSQQPKPEPIKYRAVDNLVDMLEHYYEVDLSYPDAELRLLEVFYHKIYKIFPTTEKTENISDQYWILRAEEIPEEEKNLGPHDGLVHVCHFNKEAAPNQTWKFAFLLLGRPEYLEDLDSLLSRFQQRDACGAWCSILDWAIQTVLLKGHMQQAHQNCQSHGKPVNIYN